VTVRRHGRLFGRDGLACLLPHRAFSFCRTRRSALQRRTAVSTA
jgi:hypothetical protein